MSILRRMSYSFGHLAGLQTGTAMTIIRTLYMIFDKLLPNIYEFAIIMRLSAIILRYSSWSALRKNRV